MLHPHPGGGHGRGYFATTTSRYSASGLLRDTSAKLVEISLAVGYESEAAFSRAFKREVGVSPGAWRREKRGAR